MLDRASVVHENFINRVNKLDFPAPSSQTQLADTNLTKKQAVDLFDSQIKSRLLDIIARQLKDKGESFYTIGSSGHEGNAVLGMHFPYTDMAFLHYRSGAFYIQRAKQLADCDPVRDILKSLVASSDDAISSGRHKVFGSVELTIPPQTSTIASHLPKALGTAVSITRAKELAIEHKLKDDSVVICSFGDASANHASAQTSFNACQWIGSGNYPLPLIWVCEDNGIGISVPSPKNWIQSMMEPRCGIRYIQCDGLNIADIYLACKQANYYARIKKQAVFLHIECVRLLGHAGSDIESQYRSASQIEAWEANDPLLHSARILYQQCGLSKKSIIELYQNNEALIQAKSLEVIRLAKLDNKEEIMRSITPRLQKKVHYLAPGSEERKRVFADGYKQLSLKRNLCQQINFALTDLMMQYPNLIAFGEDVGKKGGVYRVTADLQKRFGARRVFDTLLDETTILGTAIGMAHNGFIPIPEIQFLAYLHNAEDQLRGEAATLSFFSDGQYANPMVIRIASLAYQRGFGGHFHNDNSISVLRDIPGLIVACPSNGPDAAKMLRTCVKMAYEQGRIVAFLEPIALYMMKDLHQVGDNGWLFHYPDVNETIEVGEVHAHGQGDTVILTYGNGYYLSRQAQQQLKQKHQIDVKVVDLRWLNPLPEQAILKLVTSAKRILIVDEGRRSGSVSEGIITLLIDSGKQLPPIKRITGEDCFIPLGNAWQHVLPSSEQIVKEVAKWQLSANAKVKVSK